jgi:hypothetical protein
MTTIPHSGKKQKHKRINKEIKHIKHVIFSSQIHKHFSSQKRKHQQHMAGLRDPSCSKQRHFQIVAGLYKMCLTSTGVVSFASKAENKRRCHTIALFNTTQILVSILIT